MHKPKIIFHHGFLMTHHFWQKLLPWFKEYNYVTLGEQYFLKQPKYSLDTDATIGIGHSLGFTKLLLSKIKFSHLIGLNAFTNFVGTNKKISRRRNREHHFFAKNLEASPSKTIKDFYKRAHLEELFQPDHLNMNTLCSDVKLLLNNIELPQKSKILIINSKDDPIVPFSVSSDNFNNSNAQINYLSQPGHCLGFRQAEKISVLIKRFLGESAN